MVVVVVMVLLLLLLLLLLVLLLVVVVLALIAMRKRVVDRGANAQANAQTRTTYLPCGILTPPYGRRGK